MSRLVGRKLRSARLQNKYTREQVASLLAISVADYSEMEIGRRELIKEDIEDFCNLFGLDKKDLTSKDATILQFKRPNQSENDPNDIA